MTTYLVAVHLLMEAGPEPRHAITGALHDILSDRLRQNGHPDCPLIDWAVSGDDLAASMSPVDLPDGYVPDQTPFPSWLRCEEPVCYTALEMEAALCVWEHLNDITVCTDKPDPAWMEYREGVGSAELRHESIAIGRWALEVYDLLPQWYRESGSYDWEIIPAIVGELTPGETSRDPAATRDAIVNGTWARKSYLRDFDNELKRVYGLDVEQGLGMTEEDFNLVCFDPDVAPRDGVGRLADKFDLEAIR